MSERDTRRCIVVRWDEASQREIGIDPDGREHTNLMDVEARTEEEAFEVARACGGTVMWTDDLWPDDLD